MDIIHTVLTLRLTQFYFEKPLDIKPLIQTVYDLRFNPARRGNAGVGPALFLDDRTVVVYPNAIDVMIDIEGKDVHQIKWEILDGDRVSNVTYREDRILTKVYVALQDYIQHTE